MPLQHVVVMVQENRTMNTLFATLGSVEPGVTGTTVATEKFGKGKKATYKQVYLKEVSLFDKVNLNHLHVSFVTGYDKGKMDAFNQILFQATKTPEGNRPYQYVDPQQVAPYWIWPSNTRLPTRCSQRRAAAVSPPIKTSFAAARRLTPPTASLTIRHRAKPGAAILRTER